MLILNYFKNDITIVAKNKRMILSLNKNNILYSRGERGVFIIMDTFFLSSSLVARAYTI